MSHFSNEEHESAKKRRSTGRLYGARNYSKQMVQTLLDSVETILPIEPEEWQTVADQFNYHFHDNRQVKSIRRKFMDMVNDRKTTAANAPEEIRRAKNLHVKLMNKRRQNPHLGKEVDIDDVSSESGNENDESFGMEGRMSETYGSAPAVPVQTVQSSSPNHERENRRIMRQAESSSNDHYEPSPILIQMMKFWEQHHQQVQVPYQQQLLEQLRIVQSQNQQIIDLLSQQKRPNSKKRSRENDESDSN